MIVILDYEMGNVGSILNMISRIGATAEISGSKTAIKEATGLILPGVGSFDQGVLNLQRLGIWDIICEKVISQKCPILGICLGMQLLTESSEEGSMKGLGWIQAKATRFNFGENIDKLKIPHMGWNTANPLRSGDLFCGFDEPPRFYFVHSYHVCCSNQEHILATSIYGYEFVSAVNKDNIFGVQFHPEKSHKFGLKLLSNFIKIVTNQ